MKIQIYGLMLLSICNHLITMSVVRNTNSSKDVGTYNTTIAIRTGNSSVRVRRKKKVLKTRTSTQNSTFQMYDISIASNIAKDLVPQTTNHMHVPNTRLHEIVLRTPFILTYDQRDVLTNIVKKLWWNCR